MIALDYRDKRPIYEQVADKLSHLIVCGVLTSNTKMPSVRALALELSVNPNTIQRAYAQLEQDGYLYTVMGRGNFVTDEQEWKTSKQQSILETLKTLLKEAQLAKITKERIMLLLDDVYSKGGNTYG
ncbi:MAG: GntR family transcriptional regulator [Lachnospiraceae bacterium]|jgi:GntR family transcriptional regulator|nr:GntR family transcriptional regulator [Lachnospiraceae bacterium]